jgi:hypothetical protein
VHHGENPRVGATPGKMTGRMRKPLKPLNILTIRICFEYFKKPDISLLTHLKKFEVRELADEYMAYTLVQFEMSI